MISALEPWDQEYFHLRYISINKVFIWEIFSCIRYHSIKWCKYTKLTCYINTCFLIHKKLQKLYTYCQTKNHVMLCMLGQPLLGNCTSGKHSLHVNFCLLLCVKLWCPHTFQVWHLALESPIHHLPPYFNIIWSLHAIQHFNC